LSFVKFILFGQRTMRFQCGKFGATIFINKNTHLVWSQIYISAPSSCHNTELQDFKRFF